MTARRLSIVQWLGLLVGAGAWFAEFLAGLATTQAACNPASRRWGVPLDALELGLMAFGLVAVAGAELAALVVFRATRGTGDQDPPPAGRLHFFASAALLANAVFFVIILLTGVAVVVDRACHQA